MTTLLLLVLVPVALVILAKLTWQQDASLGELSLSLLVGILVLVGGWYLTRHLQTRDVELLNGAVVSKHSKKVSCEHSYSCNCVSVCSGEGSSRTCTDVCSTCYEHDYDVNWHLDTSVGDIKIDRVNRRGTTEPPRYTKAAVGDPVALPHTFTNYLKASPGSLFNTESEKQVLEQFKSKIPNYPYDVYDYHYVNRVLSVGVALPDLPSWNNDLALRLRELGPSRQVNIILVVTNEQNPEFAEAIRVAWLGGKKNDVIVVIGTPSYPAIGWARVVSWSDKETFKVQLRDALLDLQSLDRVKVLNVIEQYVAKGFVRKPWAEFEYLSQLIEPPGWAIALMIVLSTLASQGYLIARARYATRFRSRPAYSLKEFRAGITRFHR